MRKFIALLLFFMTCNHLINAQVRILASDYHKIDSVAEEKARTYAEQNRNNSPLTVNRQIRVFFWIAANNDGSSPAATEAQMMAEFNQLVNDYAPNNLCFAYMGFGYIYNTDINVNIYSDSSASAAALNPYLVPTCITIFFQTRIRKKSGGVWGGYAYEIPNTYCSVATGNLNRANTTTHEVGHCIGLLHTFETSYGVETINGSNCATTGDRVCDTPADPYGRSCATVTNCVYSGSCTDANGASNYNPPISNIMAYWPIASSCTTTTLTNGQFTRTNSFLSTNAALLNTQSPANNVFGPAIINGIYQFVSAINNVNTTGIVDCVGNCIVGFSGRKVTLSVGFKASPTTGKVTIKANECNY